MSNFLNQHNAAFRAELMKLKRSGLFWTCLGFAAFLPIIYTLVSLYFPMVSKETAWPQFLEMTFSGFCSFFYPLFLIITMVRIVYLEHRSDTWKLMETQPVSKLALFLSKYEVAILISLLTLFALLAFSVAGGLILTAAKPKLGFGETSIDWGAQLVVILRFWVASLGLIAIQYFLALLMRSFAWPLIIGLVAIMVGSILLGFKLMNWFPYSAPSQTVNSMAGSSTGSVLLQHEWTSLLWAIVALWLAYVLFVRKSFRNAFLGSFSRIAVTVLVLVVFGIATAWINKPVHLSGYKDTILAGSIISEKKVSHFALLNESDTLLSGRVKDGRFHARTTKKIEKGIYFFKAGDVLSQVYFGSNDSIFLKIIKSKERQTVKVSGTLVAENQYLPRMKMNYSFLEDYAYYYSPADYAMMINNSWKEGVEQLEKFRTADNISLSKDFQVMQKKLMAVELLRLVNIKYPGVFAIYYPNDTLKYPRSIDRLQKELSLDDPMLAKNSSYNSYVTDYIRMKSNAQNDSMFYSALKDSVKSPEVRNAVMFNAVGSRLERFRDTLGRMSYLQASLPLISDDSYRKSLLERARLLNSMMRGQPAPGIQAESLTGKDFELSQLKGRYVVIDVWATWCGPCKKDAPYFEDLAKQYTSENLAFVALSVDEEKPKWVYEAAKKRNNVMQLWAANGGKEFAKAYALSTIPRYMFIDPMGRIINVNMPSPQDPEFETILKREIPNLYSRHPVFGF